MNRQGNRGPVRRGRCDGSLVSMMAMVLIVAGGGGGLAEIPDRRSMDLGLALYEQGRGAGGREIRGRLGNGVELTGSTVACANCHGRDGRGLSEGGLRAPDIRWNTLADRFAPVRQGVVAVPYDQSSLVQTLATGRRPDGSVLSSAMPRFDLTEDEVSALVERLIALSSVASSAPPVVLGVVPQPGLDRTADQLVRIVEQCPEKVSPQPTAAIRWVRYRDPDDARRQLTELHARETNLLVVAPYVVGWEDHFAEWTGSRSLTVALPFAMRNPPGSERWLYRLPGVERQVERLMEVAADRHAGGVTLAIDPRDPLSEHLGAVAERMAKTLDLPIERWLAYGRTQTIRHEWPLLWLRPTKGMERERFLGRLLPRTVLIPSLFYDPSNVPKSGRWAKTDWLVAYPYHPQEPSTGRWLAPAMVWGHAVCHLLMVLAGDLTGAVSRLLDLAPLPLVIPPRQTDAEARALVGLMTNPHVPAR